MQAHDFRRFYQPSRLRLPRVLTRLWGWL